MLVSLAQFGGTKSLLCERPWLEIFNEHIRRRQDFVKRVPIHLLAEIQYDSTLVAIADGEYVGRTVRPKRRDAT